MLIAYVISLVLNLRLYQGHAIAQAVSSRLLTAAARVRARVKSCGICDGQSGTGAKQLPQYQMDSVSPHERKK
jgi:hypothetical protein